MRNLCCLLIFAILSAPELGQAVRAPAPQQVRTVFEGRPAALRLAPHRTTTIRLPDPVNAVVVGDPDLFHVEYSPDEPLLVFAKPVPTFPVESNLVISTTLGRQFILSLESVGSLSAGAEPVDLLVHARSAGILFIEETFPDFLISETRSVGPFTVSDGMDGLADPGAVDPLAVLDDLLDRQRRRSVHNFGGGRIRVAVGEVLEDESRLIVLFSVVNAGREAAELVPPQVQLADRTRSGLFRRTRWNTVQQLPIEIHRLTTRRLEPGERADGIVVFERPPIKQSTESLFLQIADSAAVDQPVLTPVRFRATN